MRLYKTGKYFLLGHRLDAAEDGIQKPLIKKTSPFGSKKMKTTVNTPKRRNVIPKLATPRIDSIFRDAGELVLRVGVIFKINLEFFIICDNRNAFFEKCFYYK